MQIIEWVQFLEDGLPGQKKSSMTIGIFDGVHRGHQALIERIVSRAETIPVVITFRKDESNSIQTFRQKAAMFELLGVKILLVIDFTESFRRTAGIEFLELLFKRGKIGYMAIGRNFRCGCQLDTGAEEIRDYFNARNIHVEIVPDVTEGSAPVSSSRIRSAIAGGNLLQAREMLKFPYVIDLAMLPNLVLPPPGEYQAILREKQKDAGTRATIKVETGAIYIPEPFANLHWEFAEIEYSK
ncbi:MAG: FAD synthetase family protein [Treponema sp.]|jgi:riboflavin kinase/FMN adenylyltransferase|nr:FAD synthetase family protein [Treponema sp.]